MTLEEGWYLMSVSDLEIELKRWREQDAGLPSSNAERLAVEDALAYRNAGNLPDEQGRTLRLVLRIDHPDEVKHLARKRLVYEPDFHDAPAWRKEGSKPVNVVPLRRQDFEPLDRPLDAWWDDPDIGALEAEWADRGTVAGLTVPGAYRGYVYKTVLELRASGLPITASSVADSIARWVPAQDAALVRRALLDANPTASE